MKRLLAVLLFGATVALPSSASAAGKNPQNYICHWSEDEQIYVLIRVSDKGAANHLLHHELDFTATKDTDCNATT